MKVLCRCVSLGSRTCAPATPKPALTTRHRTHCLHLRPGSRGITDETLAGMIGNKPNAKIMGATQPEALKKYEDADKILCF